MTTKNDLQGIRRKNGIKVRAIMDATGFSEAGVMKCLRENRLPKNPHQAKSFAKALGITETTKAVKL